MAKEKIYRGKIMFTIGKVMFVAGILGMALCGVTLCMLPRIFQKQKRNLLKELENQ